MTRAEMLALLTKAGIILASTALDAEVKAAFELHCLKTAAHATAPPAGGLTEATVAAVVAKAIKAEREALETELANRPAPGAERVKATDGNGAAVVKMGEDRPVTSGQRDGAEGSGLNFVRHLKAMLASRLDQESGSTVEILKGWGYDHVAKVAERHGANHKKFADVTKALGQSTLAGGGALVPPEFSTEFIALLRNVAVVRRSGCRTVPLNGTLTMPKATAAGSAAYMSEGSAITHSQQTVGDITFTERQLAALTSVSNSLIRNASLSAEQFVLDDLKAVMALREDLAFLFGNGASDTPKGIESLMAGANILTAVASVYNVPTLSEIKKDISRMLALLMAGNVPMTNVGWLMNPRTWAILDSITDGNGNAVFSMELEKGKFKGYPFIVTNQIGNTYGSTSDESRLILGDWAQAIIAEAQVIQAEVFPNGTYESGGTVYSGISRDQSVVRLIAKHDFNVRYNTAFVDLKVRWGAA